MKNFKIRILGKVERTGFHYFVKQLAQLNNINGFVDHPSKGGITIEAEGDESDMNRFLEYCLEGPNGSKIASTNICEQAIKKHTSFSIIETPG